MAVTRITTDISDGNNSRGVAFATDYQIASAIPSGSTLTRLHIRMHWNYDVSVFALANTFTSPAGPYPFNVTIQLGNAGFSVLAATRGNYGNAVMFVIDDEPTAVYLGTLWPGSANNSDYVEAGQEINWTGELYLAASTDIWVTSYAAHQAAPQSKFTQHGTANVFYG